MLVYFAIEKFAVGKYAVGSFAVRKFRPDEISTWGIFGVRKFGRRKFCRRTKSLSSEILQYGNFVICVVQHILIRCLYWFSTKENVKDWYNNDLYPHYFILISIDFCTWKLTVCKHTELYICRKYKKSSQLYIIHLNAYHTDIGCLLACLYLDQILTTR